MSNSQETTEDFVLFVSPGWTGALEPGAERDFGKVQDFFTRKKEDLHAEWEKIVTQISSMLVHLPSTLEEFQLQEVQFALGFSAEGHLGFIAKAGANATVTVSFKRKP